MPCPALHRSDELGNRVVERLRVLEIEGVASPWQDDQPRGRYRPLQHERGLERAIILVAGDDQDRRPHHAELIRELVQGLTFGLHSAHRQRRAFRVVACERGGKVRPCLRVLVLQLHARRPDGIPSGDGLRSLRLKCICDCVAVCAKRLATLRLGAIPDAGDDSRAHPVRMEHRKIQRGETPHRQSDNVSRISATGIEHGACIVDGLGL
jgi:hypothetical protein